MFLFAEGFSEKAQEQLAEAVRGAAGKEPLAYLVLAFSIAVLIILGYREKHVLRFIRERDDRDEQRQQRHEASEAARMKQMQDIGNACHLNQREMTAQTSAMFEKFGDRLDENTSAVARLIQSEQTRRLGS